MTTIPATKNEVVIARLVEINADLKNIAEHLHISREYVCFVSLTGAINLIDRIVANMDKEAR